MSAPRRVVVASKNPDKIREVEAVLASLAIEVVDHLDWPDIEETEDTLHGNAVLKATAVAAATGEAAVADDTGSPSIERSAAPTKTSIRSPREKGMEGVKRTRLDAAKAYVPG